MHLQEFFFGVPCLLMRTLEIRICGLVTLRDLLGVHRELLKFLKKLGVVIFFELNERRL